MDIGENTHLEPRLAAAISIVAAVACPKNALRESAGPPVAILFFIADIIS